MSVIKTGLAFEPLEYVMTRLRPLDRSELFATRAHDDPSLAAQEVMNACAPYGTMFWHGGVPVSAVGYFPMWPGVVSVWAFGTLNWRHVVSAMTRYVIKDLVPFLLKLRVHRAECRSLATRKDSQRWLRALGAYPEATLKGFGRNREDFTLYAWSDHNHGISRVVH